MSPNIQAQRANERRATDARRSRARFKVSFAIARPLSSSFRHPGIDAIVLAYRLPRNRIAFPSARAAAPGATPRASANALHPGHLTHRR